MDWIIDWVLLWWGIGAAGFLGMTVLGVLLTIRDRLCVLGRGR